MLNLISNVMKSTKVKALTSAVVMGTTMFLIQTHAFADKADDALKAAGIESKSIDGSGKDSFFGSVTNLIFIVMGIGGLWSILFIVIGAMTLSGSNGNPQKRAIGIGSLFTAAIGLFIIYKAWDIGGWAISLGKGQ
ncbi:hypothetical protein ACQKNX_22635 [Lysinibacillus sp. NPDC093712]|uniref:hypothetical protein n=1 Tax=Lysinibacillus sp. NPDC093712 TaxID=3390579 RepID=UPI003D02C6CB